ncbi:hypothetical protein AXF42_Ash016205 [Apostasia shenzhenica]|uniref:Uncharacterized protein n=1 Tax=Apostasia shenzhenica TaxID=1088818 RepID=A0A2I0AER5_9ASPA|nr:hypothetical protein AXF42_Ash016205 [Apostasia shenzhenica]
MELEAHIKRLLQLALTPSSSSFSHLPESRGPDRSRDLTAFTQVTQCRLPLRSCSRDLATPIAHRNAISLVFLFIALTSTGLAAPIALEEFLQMLTF